MIPRGAPDIGWADLLRGLVGTLLPGDPARAQLQAEAAWPTSDVLACLSVRSGFDLVLQDLALPMGSQVLVSALTIPGMLQILEHHGLVAVPVDLDPVTLGIDITQLAQAIGPQTRAVLVAHLFGSRMPLEPLLALAHAHGLLVIEDCAQAYDGSYTGHPAADLSLFSFGPIKTATALGGALVRSRDPARLARLRQRQANYPRQSQRSFAQRVVLFGLLRLMARPWLLGLFVALCRLRGIEHDQTINRLVRGFGAGELIRRIRHRPALGLLRLLRHRLGSVRPDHMARRIALAQRLFAALPTVAWPGQRAATHCHWVLPIISRDPEGLVQLLWASGFDATRRASSLVWVPPPAGTTAIPAQARRLLDQIVYLPVYLGLSERDLVRLASTVRTFEERQVAPLRPAPGAWAPTPEAQQLRERNR